MISRRASHAPRPAAAICCACATPITAGRPRRSRFRRARSTIRSAPRRSRRGASRALARHLSRPVRRRRSGRGCALRRLGGDRDRRLGAAGRAPAAFICEALYGNAGGIVLPDGYLEAAYAHVRAAGGVCIADEVQVGYGRLGSHFWGFEQQGVVPDIVTIAKATGNGHPVAAVITTGEIADRSRTAAISSPRRGSPVSCEIGLAVLDVLEGGGPAGERPRRRRRAAHGPRADRLPPRDRRRRARHGPLPRTRPRARPRDKEPARKEAHALCERLRERGAIVQPTGEGMNVLKLKPPLVFERPRRRLAARDARRRACARVVGTVPA